MFKRVGMWTALLALVPAGAAAPQEAAPPWLAALQKIERAYGLKIESDAPVFPVETSHGKITGARAHRRELAEYAPLFAEEFGRYPAELVRRTGVKRIVLCRDLAFAGETRAAIPDYDHTVMYYDAARASYSPSYQRATIHHEFYHMIDWKDDQRVYEDEAWGGLNRAGFAYGRRHVRGVDRSLWGRLDESLDGFLNRYSMTGVQEDKAEIFCYLIFKPEMMAERARADAVVARKVEAMKKLVGRFAPEVEESFWSSASTR